MASYHPEQAGETFREKNRQVTGLPVYTGSLQCQIPGSDPLTRRPCLILPCHNLNILEKRRRRKSAFSDSES